MRLTFFGGRLIDRDGERDSDLLVDDGKIAALSRDGSPAGLEVDASGLFILPGFIDVHTHGGGGLSLHTDDPAEILRYSRWVASTGVTSYLIGVVGTPGRIPDVELRTAREAIESPQAGARPLGIHLEGPYINPLRRGAHDLAWLRLPHPDETDQILDIAGRHLRLVTLAPELPGADAMIRALLDADVTVSIGHTDATYEQAREAIRLGITHATHCFNAMPPLLHRAPGPIGAIVEARQVGVELIGDGHHVHPSVMRLLIRAVGPARAVVVTDALAAAGQPAAAFTFAGQTAQVVDGVARLADGTITGSVLTMDQALRNLVDKLGVSLPDASAMLSFNPARAVGLERRKGRIAVGYDADLAIFGRSLQLLATYRGGALVYESPAWIDRLTAR